MSGVERPSDLVVFSYGEHDVGVRVLSWDGQIVVPSAVPEIFTDDEVSGYIYVLRSRSEDPQIAGIKDLHKIGFTRDAVEKRVR